MPIHTQRNGFLFNRFNSLYASTKAIHKSPQWASRPLGIKANTQLFKLDFLKCTEHIHICAQIKKGIGDRHPDQSSLSLFLPLAWLWVGKLLDHCYPVAMLMEMPYIFFLQYDSRKLLKLSTWHVARVTT